MNVFVSSSGTPLLADFGLSQMLSGATITMVVSTNAGQGSIRWMSPELLNVTEDETQVVRPDFYSDMWAFGMIIYVNFFSPFVFRAFLMMSCRNSYPESFLTNT